MTERICNQYGSRYHDHSNMKKTSIVVGITLITMIAEIAYGLITGSMALLADGIHMGTHTFALTITVIAYYIATRHARNPNFAFSSGKVGVLGGFTSAIVLGLSALYMAHEAVRRLLDPQIIIFDQALLVAAIGLSVNIVSALLLSSGGHDHDHESGHDRHHDHNLRAAYLHVVADAMTSVLAIAALLTGKYLNLTWPDAAVAVLGSAVILKWAYGLLVSSGSILVDYYPVAEDCEAIQSIADEFDVVIRDLHVWKTSENNKAMILSGISGMNFDRDSFAERIRKVCNYNHLTLDVDSRKGI